MVSNTDTDNSPCDSRTSLYSPSKKYQEQIDPRDRFVMVAEDRLFRPQVSEFHSPEKPVSKSDVPLDSLVGALRQSPVAAVHTRSPCIDVDPEDSQVQSRLTSEPGMLDEQCRLEAGVAAAGDSPSAVREPLRLVPEPPRPEQFGAFTTRTIQNLLDQNEKSLRDSQGPDKVTIISSIKEEPGVDIESSEGEAVEAEVAAQWMAGLRSSCEEEKACDDPLVFGSGFNPPKRLSSSDECGPWAMSFDMGGEPSAPRKAKPDLKAKAKPDTAKPELNPAERAEAKPTSFQHRERMSIGSQVRPQAAPQTTGGAQSPAQERKSIGPQARPQAVFQSNASQVPPPDRRSSSQGRLHAAPKPACMQTSQERRSTGPQQQQQQCPRPACMQAPTQERQERKAAGSQSRPPCIGPQSSASQAPPQARTYSCPRGGGPSGSQPRPQSPTGMPQNRNPSPTPPSGYAARPQRPDHTEAGPGYPHASKATGRGPVPAPSHGPSSHAGPSHPSSGGPSPQSNSHRASTGGVAGGSRGRQAPRAKAEAGSARPKPACATAKAYDSQSMLLDALKKQMQKVAKVKSADDRKKHFQRLCFQWHPDKNPANTELATKGFQMLQEQKARIMSN